MFEHAADKHFDWNCSVGGCSETDRGKIYGTGCVLDSFHVLTARHCWYSGSRKHPWSVVLRRDGMFLCDVVFESAFHDLAVLKAVKPHPTFEMPLKPYTEYPALIQKPFFLGKSVGFISRLRLQQNGEQKTITHYAQATVSAFMKEEPAKSSRWILSSTVIQTGFSGSAVFDKDGSILGVLTERLRFPAELDDPHAPIYSVPLISSIIPIRSHISALLTTPQGN